jgi:hypothetical protein
MKVLAINESENAKVILHPLPEKFVTFFFTTLKFVFSESLGEWPFFHPFKHCPCTAT